MLTTTQRSIPRLLAGASLLVLLFGARAGAASETAPADAAQTGRVAAEPGYRLAIGGDLLVGSQGYDAENLGTIAELGVRWQPLRMLGLGGTFSRLTVGGAPILGSTNDEFGASALGLHAAWHPFAGRIDPYLRLGPTYFASMSGRRRYDSDAKASRFGLEGVLGLDLAWQNLAFGPELRYGQTNEAWFMLGLHLEGRLSLNI